MKGQLAWVQRLTTNERKSFVFAMAYEKTRREIQGGFRLATKMTPDFLLKPSFKQCAAVVRWLEKEGWQITWREVHWQGYIKHAFQRLAPTVPLPGQLRNWKLLRSYLASHADRAPTPMRTPQELTDLYSKVLRPEIVGDGSLRSSLGLQPPPE